MTDADDVRIRDRADANRYELTVGEALAGFAEYHDRSGTRIFDHTRVDDAFSGQGLGTRLAATVLDDALGRGLAVVVRCPFLRSFVEREPEYAERIRASNVEPPRR